MAPKSRDVQQLSGTPTGLREGSVGLEVADQDRPGRLRPTRTVVRGLRIPGRGAPLRSARVAPTNFRGITRTRSMYAPGSGDGRRLTIVTRTRRLCVRRRTGEGLVNRGPSPRRRSSKTLKRLEKISCRRRDGRSRGYAPPRLPGALVDAHRRPYALATTSRSATLPPATTTHIIPRRREEASDRNPGLEIRVDEPNTGRTSRG